MEKKGYSLLHVIIIILVTSIISGLTTGVILAKGASENSESYSKLVEDKNLKDFLDVYNEISGEYYKDVDKEELIQNAINGMMNYLDESYTTYLDEDEAGSLMHQLNGKYDGIGITIKDRKVINVVMNSPAQKAGVESGDIIDSVNNIKVEGKTTSEIVQMIKDNSDNVILGVVRNGILLSFSMQVKSLNVPSVSYYMTDNDTIGYMQITVFSSGLSDEVSRALKDLKSQGAKSIIIDVRNNVGGYLDQAYKTASLFLKKGKVVYSLSTKDGAQKVLDEDNNSEKLKIVVIVNGSTASAAEILAAALKDSYGATIVGKTTYGKGKVQHTYSLNDGGLVKYTSSKWLRPNGTCVDEVGITPDYIVENDYVYTGTDNATATITDVIDNQLNKAIELLSN